MKRLVSLWVLLSLVMFARVACAGPSIEHWVAPSGARVFFVENHNLPILDVEVSFAAGSVFDPLEKTGLASLTHGLLDLGVAGMDETALSNRLADLGAGLAGEVGADRASVGLRTLSDEDKRTPALDLLRAVLATPQFPAEVLAREKARSSAALKEALTQPATLAGRAFWSALYPNHPYGRQTTLSSLAAITRADLVAFHRAHYVAAQATVAIVGDVSRAQAEALAQQLTAGLPAGTGEQSAKPAIKARTSEHWIEHPSAQAHVLIGMPALRRGDADFFALAVGNYTLGSGGFVSRLMKEVRDKRGLAYSVYSQFAPMIEQGPFEIGLQTKKTQAVEAVQVARDVLAGFLASGPSEEELRAAKQNLIGSFPLRLDSNRKLLDHVALIGFYGLPLDYLDHYAENVERVTVADVKAAFARHVKMENLVTIVVGGEPRQ